MKLKIYKSLFDETTLKDINTWVDKHTDGLIKKILARPFIYMIIDNQTNLPIFIGALTKF